MYIMYFDQTHPVLITFYVTTLPLFLTVFGGVHSERDIYITSIILTSVFLSLPLILPAGSPQTVPFSMMPYYFLGPYSSYE
jgi:hypothetical protein